MSPRLRCATRPSISRWATPATRRSRSAARTRSARLTGANTLLAAGFAVIVCHFADSFTLTTLFSRSGFPRAGVTAFLASVGLATAAGAAGAAAMAGLHALVR